MNRRHYGHAKRHVMDLATLLGGDPIDLGRRFEMAEQANVQDDVARLRSMIWYMMGMTGAQQTESTGGLAGHPASERDESRDPVSAFGELAAGTIVRLARRLRPRAH